MTTVTRAVLFTDIVGSTAMLRRLGNERNEAVRRAHFASLRAAVRAHDGEEVKSTGDGLMVTFASASAAVACAAEMQQSVERLNRRDGSLGLAVRIGVAVGELTQEDDDWYGTAVVEAARLCDGASGDQVLVSDLVAALAGDSDSAGVRLLHQGLRDMKGLPEPLDVHEVIWARAGAAVPMPPAMSAAHPSVFVGREREWARLQQAWSDVVGGGRRAVLIAGEPGIGKTALAGALAKELHGQGSSVVYGRCDEAVADPYQPFVEVIRHLAANSSIELMVTQAELSELRRLVPELVPIGDAEEEHAPAADPSGDPDAQRFLLFSAVESLLAGLAAEAPLLLVLDDLQWAARPTLLLLRHLLQSPLSLRVLILATYRDSEAGGSGVAAQTLADLRRLDVVTRVALTGLSEDEVTEWVGATIGDASATEAQKLVAAIHHETDGNPFFVDQVLRHLLESGRVEAADGRLAVSGSVDHIGIPDGVRDAIDQRLGRLAPATIQVLLAAAVAGRRFHLGLLERLAFDGDTDALLDALDEAADAHLVVEAVERPGHYSFAHALLQQTLSEQLEPPERARLHLAVAEALEQEEHTPDTVAALVRHFAAAAGVGGAAKAARYAQLGAEAACSRAAFDDAVALLEEGLGALDVDVDEHRSMRYDLLIALSHARRMGLEYDRADEASHEAAALARQLGSPRRLAEAAIALAGGNPRLGTVERDVVGLCEEAVAWLGDQEPALRAQLLAALAAHRALGGEAAQVGDLSRTAVDMARAAGDSDALWAALLGRYTALTGSPHAHELLATGEELMSLPVPAAGHRPNWLTLEVGPSPRVLPRLVLGDRAGFDADVSEVERLSAGYPRRATLAMLAQWRALQAFLRGDFAAAEEAANLLITVSAGGGDFGQAHAALQFWLAFEQGRLAELVPVLEATVAADPSIAAFRSSLAVFLAHLGRLDEARAQFDVLAVDGFAGINPDFTFAASLFCLGEVCALLDDAERAGELLARFTPYQGLLNVLGPGTVCMGAVDRTLGMLHALRGKWEAAEGALERALDLEQALDAPPLVARTRCWTAWMLLRRGDRGRRALELLHQAGAASDRLGMVALGAQVRRLAAAGS